MSISAHGKPSVANVPLVPLAAQLPRQSPSTQQTALSTHCPSMSSFIRSIQRASTPNLTRTIQPRTSSSLFHSTARAMGVTKTTIVEGNGPSPTKGDQVTMLYTGWLKNPDGSKGKQFDTTEKPGRGPFKTEIGVGRVIKGKAFVYHPLALHPSLENLIVTIIYMASTADTFRLGRGRRADEARREGFVGHLQRLRLRQPVRRWWPHPRQLEPHLVSHATPHNKPRCILTYVQRGRAQKDQLDRPRAMRVWHSSDATLSMMDRVPTLFAKQIASGQ